MSNVLTVVPAAEKLAQKTGYQAVEKLPEVYVNVFVGNIRFHAKVTAQVNVTAQESILLAVVNNEVAFIVSVHEYVSIAIDVENVMFPLTANVDVQASVPLYQVHQVKSILLHIDAQAIVQVHTLSLEKYTSSFTDGAVAQLAPVGHIDDHHAVELRLVVVVATQYLAAIFYKANNKFFFSINSCFIASNISIFLSASAIPISISSILIIFSTSCVIVST
jgi:hypothetical protein